MKYMDSSQVADALLAVEMSATSFALIGGMEAALQAAGTYLAEKLDVLCGSAENQGVDFGGLLIDFHPKTADQPCPAVIHDADPDGEWKFFGMIEIPDDPAAALNNMSKDFIVESVATF